MARNLRLGNSEKLEAGCAASEGASSIYTVFQVEIGNHSGLQLRDKRHGQKRQKYEILHLHDLVWSRVILLIVDSGGSRRRHRGSLVPPVRDQSQFLVDPGV